ncbi:MAG: glycosyltransferase family 1 protein, partial [Spirochaetes bacterium]
MKILLINKFLYPKGGDAISTIETGKLLQNKGHIVFFWGMKSPNNPPFLFDEYFVEEINYEGNLSLRIKLASVFNLMYSLEAKHKIAQLIKIVKPDVVHLNNFAHQISPSILDVFCKFRIPMVMTMRDYKLVCPSYSMLADGKPCERCKNGRYYFCFLKKC